MSRTIGEFVLENEEKLQRAINGTPGRAGQPNGGVGEDADDAALLAEYDKLGGLITKDGRKVKTGSFYDFDKQEPRKKPEVILELRDLDGNKVEIEDGEAIPVEVRAAEKRAGKGKKSAKKEAEEAIDDSEDEMDEDAEEAPKKKGKKSATEDEG